MNTVLELYEVDRRLYELVDPETGELLDADAFAALHMERTALIENLALWYKNASAEAEAVKAEADKLTKRSCTLSGRAQRLKELLEHFLDGRALKTPRCAVSFRASESVEIADTAAVIRWAEESGCTDCLSCKPPVLLKIRLRDYLQAGKEIPGAAIVKKRNVVVK